MTSTTTTPQSATTAVALSGVTKVYGRGANAVLALDGVSLNVNTVEDVVFSVLIIPHTLSVTTLGSWRAGSEVNIEVDLMARYAARLSEMK
jgi:riboflavin synthase